MEEKRVSGKILLIFFTYFLLCFGAYWFSSSVYRAQLPSLDSFPPPNKCVTSSTRLQVTFLHSDCNSVTSRISALSTLEESRYFALSYICKTYDNVMLNSLLHESHHKVDEMLKTLSLSWPLDLFVILDGASARTSLVWRFGKHRHAWAITSPTLIEATVKSLHQHLHKILASFEATAKSDSPSSQLLLPVHSSYTLSFTLLNEEPSWEGGSYIWHFKPAFQKYIEPFLSQLSDAFTTKVDSQIVNFGQIADTYRFDVHSGRYFVSVNDISRFVGHTGWNVVSPLSRNVIELLAVVPAPHHSPLFVTNTVNPSNPATKVQWETAFVVPRWGAVVIINPDNSSSPESLSSTIKNLTDSQMQSLMQSWLGQLREMFGLSAHTIQDPSFLLLSSPAAVADWEISLLLRQRTLRHLIHTYDTITALYELLGNVSQIPVATHIQAKVISAVEHYQKACQELSSAADKNIENKQIELVNTIQSARAAVDEADSAFFDPAMLPMIYFPAQHLYAIYAPYFVPLLLPLFGALIKRVKKPRPIS